MEKEFKRNIRKWASLLIAIVVYFVVHEGAHLIYALSIGAFKQINIIGMGVQIDVNLDLMNSIQFGIFNFVGSISTFIAAYIAVALTERITKSNSLFLKSVMYYVTLVLLFVDPLYLSFVYRFVGGGDMNGIKLLLPEQAVSIIFGIILIVNSLVFFKFVLPKYKSAYNDSKCLC